MQHVAHRQSDEVHRLRAEIERLREDPWRPMESAPKDGERFILLYCLEDDSVWLASWQGGRWFGVDDCGLRREGHSAGNPDVVTGWAVTAWMPLPHPKRALEQSTRQEKAE